MNFKDFSVAVPRPPSEFGDVRVSYKTSYEGKLLVMRPESACRRIPIAGGFQIETTTLPWESRNYEYEMPEETVFLGVPSWVTVSGYPDMNYYPEGQRMFVSEARERLEEYIKKSGFSYKLD